MYVHVCRYTHTHTHTHTHTLLKGRLWAECLGALLKWVRREVLAQIPHCLGIHRAGFPAKIPVHSAGATQSYGFKCRLICLPGQIAISFRTCFAITYKESESEVAQSCLTLCHPMDCSLQGSSVHGIFQARVLEWVVISFSRGSSPPRDQTRVSRIVGRCFTI